MTQTQYVNLDNLPRFSKGKNFIDWKRSVGCKIPFMYDNVKGEINIIGYDSGYNGYSDPHLIITIDKYVPEPLRLQASVIRKGLLYNLVGSKIINVCPDMIKYLEDPSDAYKLTYGSGKPAKMKCPICGFRCDREPYTVYLHGFSCPICGDGYSIPNKIMRNVLTQLDIDFIPEVRKIHFPWMGKYKYDFYICINNKDILIEMDGGYHKWQQETDKIKDELAYKNHFKLIRIDCDYNSDPIVYIKNNILNSELCDILNLSNIDWSQCKQSMVDNEVRVSCQLWEEKEYGTIEIARALNRDRHTIISYLRRGKEIGICPSFTDQESAFRAHNCYLMVLKNDIPIGVFRHIHCLCAQSFELFGVQFHAPSVRGYYDKKQAYRGFYIRRITREEYEQYKMINNNEVVLEKGDDLKND